jgi:hypothetical protein
MHQSLKLCSNPYFECAGSLGRQHDRIRGYAQLSATWRNDPWRANAAASPCWCLHGASRSNSETVDVKSSILGKFTTYLGYGGWIWFM